MTDQRREDGHVGVVEVKAEVGACLFEGLFASGN